MIAWMCLVDKDCERVELEGPEVDEGPPEVVLQGSRIFQEENENDIWRWQCMQNRIQEQQSF